MALNRKEPNELERLKKNSQDQLNRLVQELSDLEECRSDLDVDEYEELKKDAVAQLSEFEASLAKMSSGDMTLMDELSSMKLAVRAAISEAFKTPEVIRMFASRRPGDLRQKLIEVERDLKVGKLKESDANYQKLEILGALQKLGETLTSSEATFLTEQTMRSGNAALQKFVEIKPEDAKVNQEAIENIAMKKAMVYEK